MGLKGVTKSEKGEDMEKNTNRDLISYALNYIRFGDLRSKERLM